jgi:hypothetical protein
LTITTRAGLGVAGVEAAPGEHPPAQDLEVVRRYVRGAHAVSARRVHRDHLSAVHLHLVPAVVAARDVAGEGDARHRGRVQQPPLQLGARGVHPREVRGARGVAGGVRRLAVHRQAR